MDRLNSRVTARQNYSQGINDLLARIRTKSLESKGSLSEQDQIIFQSKLDTLADLYQNDESLGPLRYKLYFAQALLYYYKDEDEKALDFVGQAEEVKGSSFELGDKLKNQLVLNQEKAKLSGHASRYPNLVGLGGLLAWFMFGLIVVFGSSIYQLFDGIKTYGQISQNILEQYPGLQGAVIFELFIFIALAAGVAWLFYLLCKRDKMARKLAIIIMITAVVLSFIDYAWATSIFANNQDALKAIDDGGQSGRALLWAIVWIPYFIWSKRVKATLTK